MARIVLGMWTTHGPTLSTTPDEWLLRVSSDKVQKNHPFRGKRYDFASLVALRSEENLAQKSSLDERQARHTACRQAVDRMADIYDAAQADVAVIFGNDQMELFSDRLTPAFTVFNGPTIWNQPATEEQAAALERIAPGIHASERGHKPDSYTEYPGHPELADAILQRGTRDEFDLTRAAELPTTEGHWNSGIGHAFGFIYRQIMRDRVIPNVPIIINTFFPPNQPTARRCFELGRSVGRAILAWESDARVAVFGSGGMSHFVIDEAFDQRILRAIAERDADFLRSIDDEWLQSGTSELKNWIAAAGALFETELSGGLVDYQACYRSEAGTGTANGFVAWNEELQSA